MLTAEGLAPLEGSCELGPHVDEQVLRLLELALAVVHGLRDHCAHGLGVHGVEHIAHPLLVEVLPVSLIGQVPQQRRLLARMLQEVLDSETLDLRHCCHLHRRSLDVLRQIRGTCSLRRP